MKVIRCANSHFFDADKYTTCPVCGAGPLGDEEKKKSSGSESRFWSGKKESTISRNNVAPVEPVVKPQPLNNKEPQAPIALTEAMFDDKQEKKSAPPVADPAPKQPESLSNGTSLEDQIRMASSDSGDKTCGYFSSPSSKKQSQAEADELSGSSQPSGEPVVGWLVCVKGKHFGEPFAISAGRNSVGRMPSNKIVISGDNTVSREKHVWITYEPKKREFFIQPGESSGLAYLNDENIMETRKLNDRDFIEIGDGKYMFVSLCDERFSWEEYMDKE